MKEVFLANSNSIKQIKVENGEMKCIGELVHISGDFTIEFNNDKEKNQQ